jgi:hypothetical protein
VVQSPGGTKEFEVKSVAFVEEPLPGESAE